MVMMTSDIHIKYNRTLTKMLNCKNVYDDGYCDLCDKEHTISAGFLKDMIKKLIAAIDNEIHSINYRLLTRKTKIIACENMKKTINNLYGINIKKEVEK